MKKSKNRFRVRAAWWLPLLLMAALAGVMGCGTTKTELAVAASARTIWQARDQYVAIEKQDRQGGVVAPANSHPADISGDRLRSALAAIEVRLPGKEQAVPLFGDSELKILAEKIREGLASAGPDEDVTFAVIGHHPALLGLLKERKVTTGRVFCRDGRLQIIFGDILRYVKEDEDRRLYPYLLGSRSATAPHAMELTAKPGSETFARERSDWLTFPLAAQAAPVAPPPPRPDSGGPAPASAAPSPPLPQEKPATAGRKSVEERLLILNELRAKQLISEEEYRVKRREILNEL